MIRRASSGRTGFRRSWWLPLGLFYMAEPEQSYEEERRLIHEELGAAALAWNYVESEIAELFCTSLGCSTSMNPYYRSVVATFYAIVSFDAKLKATDAALTYTIFEHADEEAAWVTLRNKINRSKKVRNNLAHYTLVGWDQNKPGKRYWLQPEPRNPAGLMAHVTGRKRQPIYYRDDLGAITTNFQSLRKEIRDFQWKVIKLGPPQARRRSSLSQSDERGG